MSTYERDKLNVNGDTVNLRDAGSVRFDRAQSLTAAQQAQARDNIGANDIDAYTKTQTDTLLSGKLDASQKGAAGGVAELDSGGKVPSSQLPSYVDDVVEYASASAFPATGETGKIYVDTTDNKTYRWSGSGYVEISPSLALGETSSTAYRGDRGAAAYDHAAAKGSAFASGLYKIATNAEGHVTAATAAAKSDITALGIPGQDTTYQDATQSAAGLMSAADKAKLDGIASGAQVNSVTGVKGDAEGSYRTGDVNITPANIGAVATSGYQEINGELSVHVRSKVKMGNTPYHYGFIQFDDIEDGVTEAISLIGYGGNHNLEVRETKTNGGVEGYIFPFPTRDSGYKSYNVLTSKSAVTIPQGGTGATDAASACNNLGAMQRHVDSIQNVENPEQTILDARIAGLGLQSKIDSIPAYTAVPISMYYDGNSDSIFTHGTTYAGLLYKLEETGGYWTVSLTNNLGEMVLASRNGSSANVSFKRVI